MGGPAAELWSSPQPSAISGALRALAGSYTVTMGRPVAARRTWLDSADRRLYHAGLASDRDLLAMRSIIAANGPHDSSPSDASVG